MPGHGAYWAAIAREKNLDKLLKKAENIILERVPSRVMVDYLIDSYNNDIINTNAPYAHRSGEEVENEVKEAKKNIQARLTDQLATCSPDVRDYIKYQISQHEQPQMIAKVKGLKKPLSQRLSNHKDNQSVKFTALVNDQDFKGKLLRFIQQYSSSELCNGEILYRYATEQMQNFQAGPTRENREKIDSLRHLIEDNDLSYLFNMTENKLKKAQSKRDENMAIIKNKRISDLAFYIGFPMATLIPAGLWFWYTSPAKHQQTTPTAIEQQVANPANQTQDMGNGITINTEVGANQQEVQVLTNQKTGETVTFIEPELER